MPIQVLMPALSPTMEKGNLAKWLKKEGEPIRSGDVIAEIETDKATMEVEATDEGTLGKILIPEGTADVAVNTPIAMILADGENAADLAKADSHHLRQAALNRGRKRSVQLDAVHHQHAGRFIREAVHPDVIRELRRGGFAPGTPLTSYYLSIL